MSAQPIEWPAHHEAEWSEQDLMRMPDNGHRYETLWGSLIVTPPPFIAHQRAEARILAALLAVVPSDWDVLVQSGVRLVCGNVEPDVVVLRPGVAGDELYADYKHVALVIEVASRSTRARDANGKLEAYAESGIPVYLRVTLGNRPAVHVHTDPVAGDEDDPSTYKESVVVPLGQTHEMSEPFPFTVDPARWLA